MLDFRTFRLDTDRRVAKRPIGLTERIGGHEFPPREGENLSDAERIARLEDAVRALRETLLNVAGGVERIAR
jgi:hypothetical protein